MPIGQSPAVFVSSTCYDLAQVRENLVVALRGLGLDPVVSESASFPVAPDRGTIDNCLAAVDSRADIFVLVVGQRYGSRSPHGPSVTNLEYLRAKAKGIPVYVFVSRVILDTIRLWRRNPYADFSDYVDTTDLYRFVSELRDSGSAWVYPFSSASDIEGTLRSQLPILFMEALAAKQRLATVSVPPTLRELDGELMRLLVDRPPLWEYRLFVGTMESGIALLADKKRDALLGVSYARNHIDGDVLDWMNSRRLDLLELTATVEKLFLPAVGKEGSERVFGPPGKAGNPEEIVYLARGIVKVYDAALSWIQSLSTASAERRYERLFQLGQRSAAPIVDGIEQFASDFRQSLDEDIALSSMGDDGPTLRKVVLMFPKPDLDEFIEEWVALASGSKGGDVF